MDFRYIADTHLYYPESVLWRKKSLDDYASDLITKWNCNVLSEEEWTIVVGDVGEYCQQTIDVIKQLRGHKILVMGNHDVTWDPMELSKLFDKVVDHMHDNNVWVQHMPLETDNNNCFVIHAHHHEYDSPSMISQRNSYLHDRTRFNCAADLNGNKPCTLRQLMINKQILYEKVYG